MRGQMQQGQVLDARIRLPVRGHTQIGENLATVGVGV